MTALAVLIVFLGWFAIGTLLGGLINGLADNLPVGELRPARTRVEAIVVPRCDYCGEPRRGWRALSVLQSVFGGMRCGNCTAPRKRRDLIIELFVAACLAVVWIRAPGDAGQQVGGAVVLTLFTLVTVIDFEHRLVLMDVSLAGGALLLAMAALGGASRAWGALLGALAAASLFALLYLLGFVFLRVTRNESREAALGFGDVLLAAWVGLAVGWPAVIMSMLLAILSAGVVGLGILVWKTVRRQSTQGATMAYGPYLALAAVIVYFFGAAIARLLVRSP